MPTETTSATHPPEGRIGVNYLTPESTDVYHGTFSLLHVAIRGKDAALFRGVFAVRAFPISQPDNYISLRYVDPVDSKEHEIGVIEDLHIFPTEVQNLVHESLAKHYFEAEIVRVLDIQWRFSLLFVTVETTRGPEEFMMRWAYDRAQDYGTKGKVLLDVFDNRYVIRDLHQLPAADIDLFQRWIYW